MFLLKRKLTPKQQEYGLDYSSDDDDKVADVNITF